MGINVNLLYGAQELLIYNGQSMPANSLNISKQQNNLVNYKIVKCKNWDKDGTFKYGAHCAFAHGDAELRNKTDNLYQFNPQMQFMMPMMIPQGMDINQMQQFAPLMMMNNMNPNMEQGPGNEVPDNNEPK